MAMISEKLNKILSAVFGKDVRQALHDGLDAVNKETENTTAKQNKLETKFNDLIINAGNSNAEVAAARNGHATVGDRLDRFDSELDTIENKQFKNILNVGVLRKFGTITSAIDYAKANGVARTNRFTLQVDNGTYTEMNTLADGIDIIGQSKNGVIVQYGGSRWRDNDVFFAGFDCSIKNMTIIQISQATDTNLQNYAIHLERGNTEPFKCIIENCVIKNSGDLNHFALGFGLHDGQELLVKDSEIYSENRGAVYGHNWGNVSPMNVTFDNCHIEGCYVSSSEDVKTSVLIDDVSASIREDIIFKNCNIIYPINGTQITLRRHESFTGDRNKLFVKCYNTPIFSYSDDIEGGKIIFNDDQLVIINCVNKAHLGMPCLIKRMASNMIECELNIHDANPNVYGVAIPNNDNTYCYVRKKGVCYVQVDGTKGNVNILDDLTSTAGAFKKATTGNMSFAKALESVGNETKIIKAMLIEPRIV